MQLNNAITFVFVISLVGYLKAICTNQYLSTCFDQQSLCTTVQNLASITSTTYNTTQITSILQPVLPSIPGYANFTSLINSSVTVPVNGTSWFSLYNLNDITSNGTFANSTRNPICRNFAITYNVDVTVVSSDGTVLCDTRKSPAQIGGLANHGTRYEVIVSAAELVSKCTARTSSTTGIFTYYCGFALFETSTSEMITVRIQSN